MRRAWLFLVVAGGTVAVSGTARAITVSSFPPSMWGASNSSLGFTNPVVEDFEDTTLAPGLQYQITGEIPSGQTPSTTLPITFAPAADPNGNAFAQSVWDGTHALVSTYDNVSHPYTQIAAWGATKFVFPDGATRVGFSLADLEATNDDLVVNGDAYGWVGQTPETANLQIGSSRRNGYIVITAAPGELIYDVTIDNRINGDGWAIDHLLFEKGSAASAVVFLSDDLANSVYRYRLTSGGTPVLEATIPVQSANAFAFRDGEMFVADFAGGAVNRFLSPLGTPRANGRIASVGLVWPEQMLFVGGELWILDSDTAATANPAPLVRIGFDAQGTASLIGTFTDGFVGADRGILWHTGSNELLVSQCCGARAIQRYKIGTPDAGAGTGDAGAGDAGAGGVALTRLQPISFPGTASPHGMALSPWGELFVASTEGIIYRYRWTDATYVTNGTIRTPDLSFPVGLGFTPWGELLVANQGNGTVARMTFDPSYKPIPGGTFQTPSTGQMRLSWLAILPLAAGCAPPTAPACQPQKVDAGGGDAAMDAGRDAAVDAAPTDAGLTDARDASGTGDARDAAADRAPDAGRPGSGGGCGCRTSGTGGSGAAGVLAVALLAALARRRRRRSR